MEASRAARHWVFCWRCSTYLLRHGFLPVFGLGCCHRFEHRRHLRLSFAFAAIGLSLAITGKHSGQTSHLMRRRALPKGGAAVYDRRTWLKTIRAPGSAGWCNHCWCAYFRQFWFSAFLFRRPQSGFILRRHAYCGKLLALSLCSLCGNRKRPFPNLKRCRARQTS